MVDDTKLAGLRRSIRRLEAVGATGASSLAGAATTQAAVSFGHAEIDSCFAQGGLDWGCHQFGGEAGGPAPARAFGFMLLARYLATRPAARALVVQEASALREAGGLYGPGLHALGLDPGRLILVRTPDASEALRAVNEALRCRTPEVLLLDLWSGAAMADLSTTRRFNLGATKARALVLLTTPDLSATSAALSRWRVVAAPSMAERRQLGAPTFTLDLVRNRHGRTGHWRLAWSSHDRVFQSAISGRSAVPGQGGFGQSLAASAVAAPLGPAALDRSGEAGPQPAILPFGDYRQTG